VSDVFQIQLPDGRVVGIQAGSPQEAAQGARNIVAREKGEKTGKEASGLGFVDNLARQAANGVTFGYADEITAALDAATHGLLGRGAPGENFSDRYGQNLAATRGQDKSFSEQNPISAGAANIAGNIATSVAALPAAATAMGPSLLGNAVKMGAVGGGLGAAQGFGEGEGGFTDRSTQAALQGALGAGAGAAIPFVGAAASRALETAPGRYVSEQIVAPAARVVGGLFKGGIPAQSLSAAAPDGAAGAGNFISNAADAVVAKTGNVAERGAIDRLATALQRSGTSSSQIEARLARMGEGATLADTEQQFLREARRANTLPGETSTYAKNVLEARDRAAPRRLTSAFEGSESPPSTFALRGDGQAFDQNLRAVGQKVYGDMADAGLRQSPELMAIYENPAVAQAIDRVMTAEKATRIGTDRAPASPVEIMHKVKQAIWDLGFDKETARPGPMASWYRDLGTQYMDRLKAANPKLAEADALYSQAASLPEHFDAGRAFLASGTTEKGMNSSAPGLAELLSGANTQQQAAVRAGSTNTVRDLTSGRNAINQARSLARDVTNGSEIQARLTQIYGPDQAREIMRRAETEGIFANTSNELLKGSKTAEKLSEVMDTGNAGFRVTPGGVTPRFFERLMDIPEMLLKPNEAVRNQIGQMTLNADSAETRRILALAEELLKKRAGGASGRVGAAAGLAETLMGP